MLELPGSYWIFVIPPRKKSPPFELAGLTVSPGWLYASDQVSPPSVDSYRPTGGASGGGKGPPVLDENPWRATSVPIRMCCGSLGSIAMAPIERPAVYCWLASSRVHVWPPSVD